MAWKKWSLAGGLGLLAFWMAWSKRDIAPPRSQKVLSAKYGKRWPRPSRQARRGRFARNGRQVRKTHPIRTSPFDRLRAQGPRRRLHPNTIRALRSHMTAVGTKPKKRGTVLAKIPPGACDMIILVEGMT
ncbi:MAG: hypothetical protein H6728_06140 [Myxococcales bacterium]|nr:hypothetical protein [Myxococcales bacterium]MCB9642638.1 hypothetical protein [Myxococcales bacterium]